MNLHPHAGQFFSREFSNTLTQIFSIFRQTRIHLEWYPPKPSPRAEALPRARLGQCRQPFPSEPPGATSPGLPIRISQGARHLGLVSQMAQRTPTHTSLPSSLCPTRWETCLSHQRHIRRLKAGRRHGGPRRHGPCLRRLLLSPLPPRQTNQLPGLWS